MSVPSSKPQITTLIPTYRRPKLLRRAIRSVLAQTYPHFQVRVYDNNSADETAAVVRELADADPRVKYFCHPENIGMDENFAQAMNGVDAPYFSFLSDDDFLLPNFYRAALEGFEKAPDAAFSALLTLSVDNQCRMIRNQVLGWNGGLYRPPEGLRAFLNCGFLTWTAILFRTDIIRTTGPLDPAIAANTDTDFLLRIASSLPFVVANKVGSAKMVHEGSQGFRTRFDSIWPALTQIINKITDNATIDVEARENLKTLLTKWHIRIISRWCVQFTLEKDFESAGKCACLLRESYGMRSAAFFLGAIPSICRAFPPAYWVGSGLNRAREAILDSRLDRPKLPLAEVRDIFYDDK
jgi:GT2 family glycosyltransferase